MTLTPGFIFFIAGAVFFLVAGVIATMKTSGDDRRSTVYWFLGFSLFLGLVYFVHHQADGASRTP